MKFKTHIKTFWTVSYLWVIFSITLATLSTYSFVQVDWIIKRDITVVTSYHPFINTTSSLNFSSRSKDTPSYFQSVEQRYNNDSYAEKHISSERNSNSISIFHVKAANYSNITFKNDNNNNHNRTKGLVTEVNRTVTVVSFGLLGVCQNFNGSYLCELYNEKRRAVSPLWPMLTLVGGSGCVALSLSAVMSLLAIALPTTTLRYQAARTIGQAQAVSVVLLFLSLLGYPLGFGSDYFRVHCGATAGPYNIGDCEVGYAYALLIVCSSLALYCPVLVHFTITTKCKCLPKHL